MSDSPLSEYVTTREAAEILGLSKARVDQFCRRGRLAAVDTPLGRLIRRADLAEFSARPRPPGREKSPEKQGEKKNSRKPGAAH